MKNHLVVHLTKTTVFVLICCLLLVYVSRVVGKPGSSVAYQTVQGFYLEEAGKLDAVYIGGSNVFMYWEAPLAWEHYGIAVWPYSSDGQDLSAAEYLIREARKTQPDALYIIGISSLSTNSGYPFIHELTDFLPRNENRKQIIEHWSEVVGIAPEERMEFYFPLLRFHSRWYELGAKDFAFSPNGLKGVTLNYNILDLSQSYLFTDERRPLEENEWNTVTSLLDYCDTNNVNALFVTAPAARDAAFSERMNTVSDLVRERGYPVLDMQKLVDEIGLDLSTDFYNDRHVNIHGAVKTTDYLARYLVNHYGFVDKRGNPDYADWAESYKRCIDVISPYTLPFEYEDTEWDFSLDAPRLTDMDREGILRWETVKGADGYGIFCKTGGGVWKLLDTTDSEEQQWKDPDFAADTRYTVAAFSETAAGSLWGHYDIVEASK